MSMNWRNIGLFALVGILIVGTGFGPTMIRSSSKKFSVALAMLLLACSGGDPDDSVLPGVQAVVFVKRAFITEGGGHNVTGGNGQTIDYLRYEPGGGLYVLSPPTPDGTLTNLTEADWQRIDEQRLSPLYVSVHATEPALRERLLVNPRAGLLMQQLAWFAERNLQIHAQVVVCPGINDGAALDRSLQDLACFAGGDWPAVLSAAVVPVGLTRFRPPDDGLRPVDPACARTVIAQVEAWQKQFQSRLGSRFAWLSDEWYLIAGQALPQRPEYEDLPQQENGVGTIRAFLESLDQATQDLPPRVPQPRRCSWVVGKIVASALRPVTERLNRVEGVELQLLGLPSPYWGQDQVVTGLLTGEDLLTGLAGVELGDELLLPSVMLRQGQPVFLDDMTLETLRARLPVPIRVVHGAADIVASVLG